MKHLLRVLKGQRGFTLIELVAVMAIMAVLVAVVAPSVTGTRNASIDAQTMQDATQVRSAAMDFYKSQTEAEVRTPHSVDLTTKVNSSDQGLTAQEVSSRWPEMYVTQASSGNVPALTGRTTPSKYSSVFETHTSPHVIDVTLTGKSANGVAGAAISAATLLGDYTAIDLADLLADKLVAKMPAGSTTTSTAAGNLAIPNFLWLFEKTDSATDSLNDSREVAVFKLVQVDEIEAEGGATTVNLTYERIF
ncbi:MAG: type II secretion system protein [Chloroflexi bacterium]|nr:type II secretion system protein [Chloroflexota bacterium]